MTPFHLTRPMRALAIGMFGVAVTATPAMAECMPASAAFPPGNWSASGITINVEDVDDRSVTILAGSGGFNLMVDETGAATGALTLITEGGSESFLENDDSNSSAEITTEATLQGTAMLILADGETTFDIRGEIDVHTADDGPDPFSAGGKDLFGFENKISRPYKSQFSPSAANCNVVFGNLGGPVEFGTPSANGQFLAVRVGGPDPADTDLDQQLVELMDQAEGVLNMSPVDTDVLARFVLDVLNFDALLTSLESCDIETNIGTGHPVWAMLQSIMLNMLNTFLAAADSGAYATKDLIHVMGSAAQSGLLGWRDGDCIDPSQGGSDALDAFVRFEDILLKRLEIAANANDAVEVDLIVAAAYQFGLGRVLDAAGAQ